MSERETGRAIIIGAIIVVALGVMAFFLFRPAPESGTINPTPKQMNPTARNKRASRTTQP